MANRKPRLVGFGDNLSKIIEQWHYDKEQLAIKVGVNTRVIQGWCEGSSEPCLQHLVRLSEALKVNVADLLLRG